MSSQFSFRRTPREFPSLSPNATPETFESRFWTSMVIVAFFFFYLVVGGEEGRVDASA
jgi:hypothetical protein